MKSAATVMLAYMLMIIPIATAEGQGVPPAGASFCLDPTLDDEYCVTHGYCLGIEHRTPDDTHCYGVDGAHVATARHSARPFETPSIPTCSRVVDVQGSGNASGAVAVSGGGDAHGCLLAVTGDGSVHAPVCVEGGNGRIGISCYEEGIWIPLPTANPEPVCTRIQNLEACVVQELYCTGLYVVKPSGSTCAGWSGGIHVTD